MKVIGLIGGMSWESTALYYKIINEQVKQAKGGLHSCECLLYSVDFAHIAALQRAGEWDALTELMISAAIKLESAGAELLLICANTMHMMAPAVAASISIPLLHIADATAEAISPHALSTIGLLGTRFTMERDFFRGRLTQKHGLNVMVPQVADRDIVHQIIYEELVKGIIKEESRSKYAAIVQRLVDKGAEGIVLGCTEIPLLISQKDVNVPLFDTTRLHAEAAVAFALESDEQLRHK